ncbi:MAG: hypothetical protein WBW55_06435 [Desulfobaccales bacterium]
MGQNATWLTDNDKYRGRENDIWTPCIFEFFRKNTSRLKLPISACKSNPFFDDLVYPIYEKRSHCPTIDIDGEVLNTSKIFLNAFLPTIDARFNLKLNDDCKANTIALIKPDIFLIRPKREGVFIIENKPSYDSTFTGNQGPGEAYIEFVRWLYRNGIHCEYLLIHTACCSGETYEIIEKIQNELLSHFGILVLEHIFKEMHKNKFTYSPITENEKWIEYTDTKPDY